MIELTNINIIYEKILLVIFYYNKRLFNIINLNQKIT